MKNRRVHAPKGGATVDPQPLRPPGIVTPNTLAFVIVLSISLVTLIVYLQTLAFHFIYYDDDLYVYENAMVKSGLSLKTLKWAFTTFDCANWHPLTWVSYLLNQQLFGLNAGAEHAVNLTLHLGATALLFFALLEMTRRPGRSAVVAAIFGLHPLHVESVAWIAERKDVLSGLFQMLTLLLYARFAGKFTPKRYAYVALAFALSLLAKPMAVTLPFVLLLLDIWPLRRVDIAAWRGSLSRLVWEKIPLFAMSALACALTFMAQRSGGAVASLVRLSFAERLANAAVAYITYLGKAFWPVDLAVLYPIRIPPAAEVVFALLVVAVISGYAAWTFRARPYILMGWLWYLGVLVPVIGLVQVGQQSMANRYTYTPLIGLSIAIVWSVAETLEQRPAVRQLGAAMAGLILLVLSIRTYQQVSYWKDSETLFRHTLAVTRDNPVIESNLGVVLQREGNNNEAELLFRQAIQGNPGEVKAINNLGVVLAARGRYEEAVTQYRRALAADPDYAEAHANLGHELLRAGQLDNALVELREALRLKWDLAEPQQDMGLLLAARGQFEESSQHLEASVGLNPSDAQTQSNLCYVFGRLNRFDRAIQTCDAALQLRPDFADARFNLGNALAATGKNQAAEGEFSRALQINPNHAAARAALERLRQAGSKAP